MTKILAENTSLNDLVNIFWLFFVSKPLILITHRENYRKTPLASHCNAILAKIDFSGLDKLVGMPGGTEDKESAGDPEDHGGVGNIES